MQPQPGAKRGVLAQDVGRLGGHPPVALHHLGPLHDHLANVALRQLLLPRVNIHDAGIGVGQWDADGADSVPVQGVGVGRRAGLGHAKGFHQLAAGDCLECLLHIEGEQRRPTQADTHRTQVELFDLRVGIDAHIARRHR